MGARRSKFEGFEDLFEEAVAYAREKLEDPDIGLIAIEVDPPVLRAVEHLASEFRAADREGRGMDPYLVRDSVQVILDAAKFPKDNEPPEFPVKRNRDAEWRQPDPDHEVFKYSRRRGRPPGSPLAMPLAYTVGAVMGRFELAKHEQKESRDLSKPVRPSALEVVAEAQKRRGAVQPRTAAGIRALLEKDPTSEETIRNGMEEGREDREEALRGK